MDSFSEPRRKRNHLVQPLFLSFSFLLSIFLFFNHFQYCFHSSTQQRSLLQPTPTPLQLVHRIQFPDHVFLTLSNPHHTLPAPTHLQCLFYTLLNHSSQPEPVFNVHVEPVLSTDRFDQFRSIVRCPLPNSNFSAVDLRRRGEAGGQTLVDLNNQTVLSWNNLAYEAELDGDTAVVFVKGLNLRPHRISDPSQFKCHFGLTGSQNAAFSITTKAVSVAQEVVRCSLPHTTNNEEIITVTVSHVTGHVRHTVREVMPSVARVHGESNNGEARKKKNKHELCACTMVWNQARALREWVMYHSWLGVERWFVYDNNSDADDGIDGVVNDLDSKGYNVSRVIWPWIKSQEAGFSHCALKAKEHCNWVAFFDVDEFFHFPNKSGNRKNALRSMVSKFSSSNSVAELRTECRSFGPSGLRSHPKRGVSLGYTCRVGSTERHKSIVRPEMVDPSLLNVVHHFELREGYVHRNIGVGSVVVNHYKYQVWESFKAKFHRRVATYVVDWKEDQNKGSKDRVPGLGTQAVEPANWRFRFCEVWDTGLRDFLLSNFADPVTGLMPWETSNHVSVL